MAEYKGPDRKRTDHIIREAGIVVVMGKPQVRNKDDKGTDGKAVIRPEYIIAAVKGVWQAGLPAELTFRIPESILKEAVQQLVIDRQESYKQGEQVVLGVGSICAFSELESAIEMGFDFVVAPSNGMGGAYIGTGNGRLSNRYRDPIDFVVTAYQSNVFTAPAAFTPS